MSDVGLGATLQLEIQDALARIDNLGERAGQVLSDIPTSIAEPDASPITLAIDQAVAAANTSVTPEAEADGVTSAIDAAVAAVDGTVPVEADTSQAEAGLDALEASAASMAATIPVDADTSAADAAVDQVAAAAEATDATITVQADTSQADEAIAQVGETAAGASGGVDDLSESTEELTGTQTAAQESTAGLTNTLGALANVNTATTGSARGLGAALSQLGPGGQTAALGVGAVVGLLASFVGPALEAEQSANRFTDATGRFEKGIRDIQIGTLNGDLTDLAARLGTSDEALQDAATSIFTLGVRSGIAKPQVAGTVEQILALSLAARAANPRLGESGDIAERLAVAFAKGGKALSPYNIAITQNEILLRAQADSGGKAVEELTQYEKSAAGAAIASERYGDSLAKMVAKGEDDPAIRIAAIRNSFGELTEELGQPLIAPTLEALEALAPLGLGVVEVLGKIAQSFTPVLELLGAAAPVFEAIGAFLGAIPQQVVGVVAGLTAAAAGIGAFVTAFTSGIAVANPVLAGFLASVGLITAAVSLFGSNQDGFRRDVDNATEALEDQNGVLQLTTESLANYIDETSRFSTRNQTDDLKRLGLELGQVADLLEGGAKGRKDFIDQTIRSGEVSEIFRRTTERGGSQLDEFVDAQGRVVAGTNHFLEVNGRFLQGNTDLIKSFEHEQKVLQESAESALKFEVAQGEVAASYLRTGKASGDYIAALQEGRKAADESARSALEAAVTAGTLSIAQRDAALNATRAADGQLDYSDALATVRDQIEQQAAAQAGFDAQFEAIAARLPDVAARYRDLADGIGATSFDLGQLAIAIADGGAGIEELGTIAAGLGVPVEALEGFVNDVDSAVSSFVDNAVAKLPGIGAAFDAARARAEEAERKLTGKDILAGLNESLAAITSYGKNLETILGSAYSDLAGFAAQAGPDAVAAIAKSITDKDGKTLEALRTNFETAIPQGLQHAADLLDGAAIPFLDRSAVIAQLATQYFGENFTPAQLAAIEMQVTGQSITGAVPFLNTAGAAAGTAGVTGFEDTWSGIDGATLRGLDAAKGTIETNTPGIKGTAETAGGDVAGGYGFGWRQGLAKDHQSAGDAAGAQAIAAKVIAITQSSYAGFQVGTAFSDGVAAGIAAHSSQVQAAARKVIGQAETAAKDKAQIKSPSRVWADIGQQMGKGLEGGLEETTSAVVAAAEAITRAASQGAQNVVRLGSVPDAQWEALLAAGWKGRAGDGMEALYRPQTASVAVAASVAAPAQAAGFSVTLADGAVQVSITGDVSTDDAKRVGGAIVDGMVEQYDRRFAAEFRLSRKVGT